MKGDSDELFIGKAEIQEKKTGVDGWKMNVEDVEEEQSTEMEAVGRGANHYGDVILVRFYRCLCSEEQIFSMGWGWTKVLPQYRNCDNDEPICIEGMLQRYHGRGESYEKYRISILDTSQFMSAKKPCQGGLRRTKGGTYNEFRNEVS